MYISQKQTIIFETLYIPSPYIEKQSNEAIFNTVNCSTLIIVRELMHSFFYWLYCRSFCSSCLVFHLSLKHIAIECVFFIFIYCWMKKLSCSIILAVLWHPKPVKDTKRQQCKIRRIKLRQIYLIWVWTQLFNAGVISGKPLNLSEPVSSSTEQR